jgi:nucleotide-binding universal stress UspA family protein
MIEATLSTKVPILLGSRLLDSSYGFRRIGHEARTVNEPRSTSDRLVAAPIDPNQDVSTAPPTNLKLNKAGDLMIRTILVPATGTTADASVFATALTTARLFGGHLDFLHVHADPREIAVALASSMGGGMASSVSMIERFEAEAQQREDKAQSLFWTFCERERVAVGKPPSDPLMVSAQWHRVVGNEAAWIREYGRTSDLVVVGHSANEQGTTPEILETALLDTGRPLLIPGSKPLLAETVVIAWKSTREAARAVTAATPILAKAKRIVIVTVAEDDRMDRESGARLFAALQRHNTATEARHVQPGSHSTAETLLATAAELSAGLLVMGGYSHGRVRELIFGGVTAHVLRRAPLPVLMAH